MRNILKIASISLITLFSINVHACGEIKNLKSNIGTVTTVDSTNYLITVPEGTETITLDAQTDYKWVEGYGPRKVSTKDKVELKVDGNTCGYGIYTYFVKFKFQPKIIAENTEKLETENQEQETTTPNENTNQNTSENENTTENETDGLKLATLTIEGYEIDFNPDKYQYTIDVEYEITSLNIAPTSTIDGAVIEVSDNSYNLLEGLNVVTITITNELEEKTTYTLNVNRLKQRSDNNFLANIIVDNYQLNFDASITSYQLSIGKEKTLNITATPQSELAAVAILGNMNLEDGSVITIRVIAENGMSRDYIINIVREFNIMDYWVYIIIVLLLLLLVLLLLIIKQKKDQKKQGPETIEGQANTAGEIKEIAPQTAIATEEPDKNTPAPVKLNTSEPATLKIIEPTNIETETDSQIETYLDEDSPTEIFQL